MRTRRGARSLARIFAVIAMLCAVLAVHGLHGDHDLNIAVPPMTIAAAMAPAGHADSPPAATIRHAPGVARDIAADPTDPMPAGHSTPADQHGHPGHDAAAGCLALLAAGAALGATTLAWRNRKRARASCPGYRLGASPSVRSPDPPGALRAPSLSALCLSRT
jgi:hypothetical protein